MIDTRRDQLIDIVEKEFIGPDPIDYPGLTQENGEEILCIDPPRTRYIAGILYPKEIYEETTSEINEGEMGEFSTELEEGEVEEQKNEITRELSESFEESEELINRSNAYRQSAISITAAVAPHDCIKVQVNAGKYSSVGFVDPYTAKKSTHYLRTSIVWDNDGQSIELPLPTEGIKKIEIPREKLRFDITYRYKKEGFCIYTFTLENTSDEGSFNDSDCYFQCKFSISTEKGFYPLPDGEQIVTEDEDYWSNQLLYRNIKNYAIGHGCAADWEDATPVTWIRTAIFPVHEVKPIVPSTIPGVTLEMLKYGPDGNIDENILELNMLCDKYEEWIEERKKSIGSIEENYSNMQYVKTAERHITNCRECLRRMRGGIELLKTNQNVRIAFQYMNLAMLMQQLHYNLPLQKWKIDKDDNIVLDKNISKLPEVKDRDTWYDREHKVYGKWRPFQLAFVLMNLYSMETRDNDEREIIDLIWFPTGGGKTEAYLGLSAYTIFIRRLMNKQDSGTAILMRYTLRLLTAQQYERASAMICACDLIRKNHEELFGTNRISIGLWVGSDTTPNTMKDAVKIYDDLKNNKTNSNPFVVLKCPWCGAEMGVVQKVQGIREIKGYDKEIGKRRQKKIVFRCHNKEQSCPFAERKYGLPLYVVDEAIYEEKPTLLLGTVDKFAMLPFKPEAQGIFGFDNGVKVTSPDLIIQDELHLISGPLGSMVGHYETMIDELCSMKSGGKIIHPKIIASTATISHAKEQCNALYGREKDKVFQFPPAGLEAGDSFFAYEDKEKKGRKYVGILASGSSSDATTAIRLYASLLYAAKEIKVDQENERDPYWTNVGYFNSIRELGQARTWIRADIDQHLDVIYKRRFYDKLYSKEEYRKIRRYIYRDEELTSRIAGDMVSESLSNLNIKYPGKIDEKGQSKDNPIDICLATNMISVGLDVSRLGLMTVSGQPKTTSEYIQATSRVGRDSNNAPGIIFVLYRPGRPRDKSFYEHFKDYHSKLYCNVEPTSVTPFSSPVRERALHAIMIGMIRLESNSRYNDAAPRIPANSVLQNVKHVIQTRVQDIDPDELEATMKKFDEIIEDWEAWNVECWEPKKNRDYSFTNDIPLMYPAGSHRNQAWGDERGIKTPTSMRNVDESCEAYVMEHKYAEKEGE